MTVAAPWGATAPTQAHSDGGEPTPMGAIVPIDGQETTYGVEARNQELATLRAASEGSRNDQLNRSAFNLAELTASGHLNKQATWTQLADVAGWIGLANNEVRATLRSAFEKGEQHPRHVPDLQLTVGGIDLAGTGPPHAPAASPLLRAHLPNGVGDALGDR